MARMKICGNQLTVGDDDLGLLMLYHFIYRILMFLGLLSCLLTYSDGSETEIPQYPVHITFSV